jgi:hypothetical protein
MPGDLTREGRMSDLPIAACEQAIDLESDSI